MTTDESVSPVDEKNTPPTAKVASPLTRNEANTDAANDVQPSSTPRQSPTLDVNDTSATEDDNNNISDMPPREEATPSVEELTHQLTQASKKAQEQWDNLLRQRAEYENLRKRMTRELTNARKYALEKFATELLAVKDSMELGIDAAASPETDLKVVHDGMILTLKMLTDTMAKFDVVEINPVAQKFDPQWHEAMAMQPVPDGEDGIVLHVHQKGYKLNERLLRPARVIVAKVSQSEKPLENQE